MLELRYGSSKTISWKEANLGCIVHYKKKKSELRRQKRRWALLADSHPVLMVPFAAGFRQTFTVCLSVPGLFCS